MTFKIAGIDTLTRELAFGTRDSILGIAEGQRSLADALTATGALGEAYRNTMLGNVSGMLGIDRAMSDSLRPYKQLAEMMQHIPSMDVLATHPCMMVL